MQFRPFGLCRGDQLVALCGKGIHAVGRGVGPASSRPGIGRLEAGLTLAGRRGLLTRSRGWFSRSGAGCHIVLAEKAFEVEPGRFHPGLQRLVVVLQDVIDPVRERTEGGVRYTLGREGSLGPGVEPGDPGGIVRQALAHGIAAQSGVQTGADGNEQVGQFQVVTEADSAQHQLRRRQPRWPDAKNDGLALALEADGKGQAAQEFVIGLMDQGIELAQRIVAQDPQLRRVRRAAVREAQRNGQLPGQFALSPAQSGCWAGGTP